MARMVEVVGETWPLAGIAVVGHPPTGLDAARRRAWSLGEGDVLAWAELIDGLGEALVHDVDDVLDACERALR